MAAKRAQNTARGTFSGPADHGLAYLAMVALICADRLMTFALDSLGDGCQKIRNPIRRCDPVWELPQDLR